MVHARNGTRVAGVVVLAGLVLAGRAAEGQAQVAVGVVVGPSLSNLSGSFIESSELTAGLYVGPVIEWQISRHWAIETGFTILGQGAFSVVAAGEEGEWDFHVNYKQIPLRVRYLIPFADDRWVFGPFVGFGINFGGGCEIRPAGAPLFDDECTAETPGGEIASTDFQYAFGVVVDRVFGGSGFGFDIRYVRGTKDVFLGAAENGLTSKNYALDIKFRIIFPPFGDW